MFRAVGFVTVLGLLAGQAQVHAQTRYPIRLTKAGPGSVLLVEKQDSQTQHLQVVDQAGKTLKDQEEKRGDTVVYREKIIARPEGQDRPTHLQRQFDRAEHQVGGRVYTIPLQGKTYDIEKKAGRYVFQYQSGEAIPAEAVQALEREFNSGLHEELDWEKLILPSRPVRVNDIWQLDLRRVIQVLSKLTNMQMDVTRSSARACLSRIYEEDKHRFAVLDAVIDLATTAVVRGNVTRPLQPGSRINLILKINGCIDGSAEISTVDVRMQMKTSALTRSQNSTPGTMSVQFDSMIHEKRRQLVKQ